jgi:hypothetical protein
MPHGNPIGKKGRGIAKNQKPSPKAIFYHQKHPFFTSSKTGINKKHPIYI